MNTEPLVSVIIPCYNAEKFVEKAVRSIMRQTYRNLEIIVINDCSKDRTGIILKALADEDDRIRLVENEVNLKLPKTLNKGIALSKGEYIARMDADDISLPERIEKQIRIIDQCNVDIVGCNAQYIDEEDNLKDYRTYFPLEHKDIIHKMAWKSVLVHPSVLAKKSFFVDLGGFNENLSYAEDYELWIKGSVLNKKFANLGEMLLYYRVHNTQMTSHTFNRKHAKIIRRFLLRYFLETGNIYYLFGILVQTKLFYSIIQTTSSFRNRFKK